MTRGSGLGLVGLGLLAACAGDPGDRPPADAGVADEWTELIAADWELGAGGEMFYCARRTLDEDLFVTAFRPLAPIGTHHTAATAGPPSGADGQFGCSPDEDGNVERILFAAGVGTDDFVFPAGVALRIPAGEQMLVNLHLFNQSDAAITGRSGMLVKTIAQADVVEEAVLVTTGEAPPPIPPTGSPVTASAGCTFDAEARIFDLWPHMHQIGRHMSVALAGEIVLDTDFSFAEQRHYPMLLTAQAGDMLRGTCTYVNDTGVTVEPGNSSTQEMCVLGFYVAPFEAIAACDGL
jgi:hypothetical protein